MGQVVSNKGLLLVCEAGFGICLHNSSCYLARDVGQVVSDKRSRKTVWFQKTVPSNKYCGMIKQCST